MQIVGKVAEAVLRLGVPLRCSEPVEPPRLGKVLRHTIAELVHQAKLSLRFGVALRCSELKPPRLLVFTRRAEGVVYGDDENAMKTPRSRTGNQESRT